MSRERTFGYAVDVSEEFLRENPNGRDMADAMLRDGADHIELRGPRGGRYERIGDLYDFRDGVLGDSGYIRSARTFICHTQAVYVRPNRRASAVGSAVRPKG